MKELRFVLQARELLEVYKSKAGHESELPTVSSALRNTNKCVVNALVSLAASLQSLSDNLSDPHVPSLLGATFHYETAVTDQQPPPGYSNARPFLWA